MVRSSWKVAVVMAAMLLVVTSAAKAADTSKEISDLKAQVEALKQARSAPVSSSAGAVERALNKYGPDAPVTTRVGRLTIGGLVQVWYTSFRNDNNGAFNDPDGTGVLDTNEAQDNDSFRIRRTEIKFTMDVHENVTAVVMIDPAREAISFPNAPGNQGLFKRVNQSAPEFAAAGNAVPDPIALNDFGIGGASAIGGNSVGNVQTGAGSVPRLLQDAYINYHGVVPHHDFQIGQFKPAMGEEGIRSSAELDFVERSMVGQINDARDLGVSVHGGWWDSEGKNCGGGRFQYWVALFDDAGNYYGSAGQQQNRSDDNDDKSLNYRLLVRPVWLDECWGSLELGWSQIMGNHGEAGGADPLNAPTNGLNRRKTWATKSDAWLYYAPGSIARGLWFRFEAMRIDDRNAPGFVIDTANADFQTAGNKPFESEGGYVAVGYNIRKSGWCDHAPSWLKNFEFAARYEKMRNVQVADPVNTTHTNVYQTKVITAGVNYYISGNNAKIQLNYNAVNDPEQTALGIREVRNNNFVVNFQVAF